mgnify:CR=1 FL=1
MVIRLLINKAKKNSYPNIKEEVSPSMGSAALDDFVDDNVLVVRKCSTDDRQDGQGNALDTAGSFEKIAISLCGDAPSTREAFSMLR